MDEAIICANCAEVECAECTMLYRYVHVVSFISSSICYIHLYNYQIANSLSSKKAVRLQLILLSTRPPHRATRDVTEAPEWISSVAALEVPHLSEFCGILKTFF